MGIWDTLRSALSRSSPEIALPPSSRYKIGQVAEKIRPAQWVLIDRGDSFHHLGQAISLTSHDELDVSLWGGQKLRIAHGEALLDDIKEGDLVEADREGIFRYLSGRVIERKEEGILKILFEDGLETDIHAERVRAERIHPDVARVPHEPSHLEEGDRVLAAWGFDPFWYAGTVAAFRGDEVRVHFDDGAQAWVPKKTLTEDDIRAGDLILADRFGKKAFFHGIVTSRKGERLCVRYRDGLMEWLPIGRVRVLVREPTEIIPLTTRPG